MSRFALLGSALLLVALALVPGARAATAADDAMTSLGDASLEPETRAAVETVLLLFRREPRNAASVGELAHLLDSTPEVVGQALERSRRETLGAEAEALRERARHIRSALRALERGDPERASGRAVDRVEALADELEAAAAARAGSRRERLAALLARLRDGEWRTGPPVEASEPPALRWFTGGASAETPR